MNTESHPIADLDEARRIVAEADDALAALPAARTYHSALRVRWEAASATADRAMDNLWPLLATVVGIDKQVDAARAMAWEANEAAMNAMWAVGAEAMTAQGEVSRLEQVASGQDAMEARLIVGAADDLVLLRKVAGVGAVVETPASRRFM